LNDNPRSKEIYEDGIHFATIHYEPELPHTLTIRIEFNPDYPGKFEETVVFQNLMALLSGEGKDKFLN
jgi:hypothetical protein